MLGILLTILHVIVAFILILVVLLQTGKRADLAGAFGGGGSQTAFGTRGAATFLSKMTTAAAVMFMLTSLGLSIVATQRAGSSGAALPEGEPVSETQPAPASEAPAGPAPIQPVPAEPAAPADASGTQPTEPPADGPAEGS